MRFITGVVSLLTLIIVTHAASAASINIAGTGQINERMGEHVAAGDFNCDNFDDVAVSTGLGSQINILYGGTGSEGKLGTTGNIQIDATNWGIANRGMVVLTAGDFDNNGCDDLAMGFPFSDVTAGSFIELAGQVAILYGKRSGLNPNAPEIWHQNTNGVTDKSEPNDYFGRSLAAGDFNGDSYDDLAIGIIGEDSGAGAVYVLHGQPIAGLTTLTTRFFNQNTAGIHDVPENGDYFGFALASGDFNNDGYDDLAVGVPFEAIGSMANAGIVHTLYGSASSLSGSGSQVWQQGAGIPDTAETGDHFGYTLAAGDFNGDGRDDLVIAAPYENSQAGAVHVLYGSTGGVSAVGSEFWIGNYFFGLSLAVGEFSGNSRADLAIGKPHDKVNPPLLASGSVRLFYGAASGLITTAIPQSLDQGSFGAEGEPEQSDNFGWAVAAGDFDNDGRDDLAVGVPWEDVSSCSNCGALQVFYTLYNTNPLFLPGVNDQMFVQ